MISGTFLGENMLHKEIEGGPELKIMLSLQREHGFCDPSDSSKSAQKLQKWPQGGQECPERG